MKLGIALTAVILAFLITPAAAAHRHHHGYHHRPFHGAKHSMSHRGHGTSRHASSESSAIDYKRPPDCYGIPWCGCFMRHLEGVTDRAFDLAREWASWGHAASAEIGAIVVWPHHVGKIVGGGPGHWLVLSGNDGHRVRERERSIAGAIAIREP